ncbi:hypothetical protein [Archaeoglobus neptunius]|uniref:hypothetical protein n=1 Tax=Archaeoglobus neptunius TaxID=2798580 RepID=UPI001E4A782A|nr:hypothetical protein [Archaeoglobus neptunius]
MKSGVTLGANDEKEKSFIAAYPLDSMKPSNLNPSAFYQPGSEGPDERHEGDTSCEN